MWEQFLQYKLIYVLSRLIVILRVIDLVVTKELGDKICKRFQ